VVPVVSPAEVPMVTLLQADVAGGEGQGLPAGGRGEAHFVGRAGGIVDFRRAVRWARIGDHIDVVAGAAQQHVVSPPWPSRMSLKPVPLMVSAMVVPMMLCPTDAPVVLMVTVSAPSSNPFGRAGDDMAESRRR
jgi:hypothetical protein